MARFLSSNLILPDDIQIIFGDSLDFVLEYDTGTGPYLLLDAAATDTFRIGNANTITLDLNGTTGVVGVLDEDNMATNSATNLATQQSIKAYVDNRVNGLDWQESVEDLITDNTTDPVALETLGNRYILSTTGGAPHANWDGASAGDIVEFDGTSWFVALDVSANLEGGAAWVEDVNIQYVFNGTAWVTLSSTLGLGAGGSTHDTLRWTGSAWATSSALQNDDTDVTTTGDLIVQGGDLTLGVATSQLGTLTLAGSTSGTMSITTAVAASGTWTFPNTGTAGALETDASGNISTGILDVAYGGTGVDGSAATDGQILIGHDSNNNFSLAAIAGTTNEVVVTNGAGTITLSLPSNVYLGTAGYLGRDGNTGLDFATDAEVGVYISGDADSFLFSDAALTINSDSGVATRALRLSDLDNSAYVGLVANDTTTTYTLTWPAADSTGSQALMSNGSGVLSWASVAAGETLPTSTAQYSVLVANAAGGWVEDTGAKITSGSLDLDGTITGGSSSVQITNAAGNLQETKNFTNDQVLTDNDAVYSALDKLDTEWYNLGLTTIGNGASMVGVYDTDGHWAGTDVEAVLKEIGDELLGADASVRKHGRTAIGSGVATIQVTFSTAMGDTNYTVIANLVNTTDGIPSQFATTVQDKTSTTFDVDFSGDTDTANYVLEWIAIHD